MRDRKAEEKRNQSETTGTMVKKESLEGKSVILASGRYEMRGDLAMKGKTYMQLLYRDVLDKNQMTGV